MTAATRSATSAAARPSDASVLALADAAGILTTEGTRDALASPHPYARALGSFSQTVTTRYRALLGSLGGGSGEAHAQITAAMLSGNTAPLEAWLDARHGPEAFARLFRATSYGHEAEHDR